MEESNDYRAEYQQEVRELFRLADEAEACAKLLRQEAQRYQKALDDGELSDDELRKLMEKRQQLTIPNPAAVRITDNLM